MDDAFLSAYRNARQKPTDNQNAAQKPASDPTPAPVPAGATGIAPEQAQVPAPTATDRNSDEIVQPLHPLKLEPAVQDSGEKESSVRQQMPADSNAQPSVVTVPSLIDESQSGAVSMQPATEPQTVATAQIDQLQTPNNEAQSMTQPNSVSVNASMASDENTPNPPVDEALAASAADEVATLPSPNTTTMPVGPQVPSSNSKPELDISNSAAKPSFLVDKVPQTVNNTKNSADKAKQAPIEKIMKSKIFTMMVFLGSLSVLALLGTALFLQYKEKTKVQGAATSANQSAQTVQNQKLAANYVEEVGKLIALPKGKEPIGVATISDENKVKEQQQFFRNAKNGDVLIIYDDRAILYDPKAKVIVDIANVNLKKEAQQSATISAQPTNP